MNHILFNNIHVSILIFLQLIFKVTIFCIINSEKMRYFVKQRVVLKNLLVIQYQFLQARTVS